MDGITSKYGDQFLTYDNRNISSGLKQIMDRFPGGYIR